MRSIIISGVICICFIVGVDRYNINIKLVCGEKCMVDEKDSGPDTQSVAESSDGMSTGKKIGIGLGVCCIGLIIIILIAGMMSPDKTSTSNTTSSVNVTTTSDTNNSDDNNNDDRVTVTLNDSFMFYAKNSPASSSGYDAAVVVNGTPYYIAVENFILEGYSPAYNGGLKKREDSPVDFELKVDKPFSFTFEKKKVGANKDAHVITKLFDSSGKVIDFTSNT